MRVVIQNPVAAPREVRRAGLPEHGAKRARRVGILPRNDEHGADIVQQLKRKPVVQAVEPQHRQSAQRIDCPHRLPGGVGLRGRDAGGRLPTRHAPSDIDRERVAGSCIEPKSKARDVVRLPAGGRRPAGQASVLPRREHQQVFARRHRGFREAPLERLGRIVGQSKAVEADRRVGAVVQLDPVRKVAVLIGECRPVVGHHFADNDAGVFGQAAAGRLRPVNDVLEPTAVRVGQADLPLRRRELETQRAAVECEPRRCADETQRREHEHRRCADRLAGEPHALESHRQCTRIGQLN